MEIFSMESLGPTHIPTLKNLSGVRWSKKGPIIFSVSTLGSPSVRAQQVVDTSMLNLCKLFNFTLMYQYCRRICHHPTCHLAVLNKEIGSLCRRFLDQNWIVKLFCTVHQGHIHFVILWSSFYYQPLEILASFGPFWPFFILFRPFLGTSG